MSESINNTLEVINDFCQELVSEGFLTKANLDIQRVENDSNNQTTQLLQRFLRNIQNAAEKAKDDKQHIQIKADTKEIYRRISAFMAFKRMEVDELNVQEFCNRISVNEEVENSCARVDGVVVKRKGSKSHIKTSRVVNQWGPQTNPLQTETPISKPDEPLEKRDPLSSALEERIENMETHLKIKTNSKNVFERLKNLEDRILFLEGISPDYFNSVQKPQKRKRQSIFDYKSAQQMTLEDIDVRIASLKKSLKHKRECLRVSN